MFKVKLQIFTVFIIVNVCLALPWVELKKEPTLEKYLDTLLNEKVLKFLDKCYQDKCCDDTDEVLCPVYFDVFLQLNETAPDLKVTKENVENVLGAATLSNFCQTLSKKLPSPKYNIVNFNLTPVLNDPLYCNMLCMDIIRPKLDLNPKPICRLLNWMSGLIHGVTDQESTVKSSPLKTDNSDKPVSLTSKANEGRTEEKHKDNLQEEPEQVPVQKQKSDVSITPEPKKIDTEATKQENPMPIVGQSTTKKTVLPDEELNPEQKKPVESVQKSPEIPHIDKAENLLPVNEESNIENNPEEDLDLDEKPNDLNMYGGDDDPDGEIEPPQSQADTKPKEMTTLEQIMKSKAAAQKKLDTNKDEETNIIPASDPFYEESGPNFFTYFFFGMFACILLYVLYHNKSKVLALFLEGRRSQKGRNGRRKHTAAYRKLDSNLEEAITSSASGRSSQIIY